LVSGKEISLDLRDATLVEMDLSGCRMNSADFRHAQFHRTTVLNDTRFPEDASFQRAIFWGDAWFSNATFPGDAQFDGAKFAGDTSFQRGDFKEVAFFNRARFQGKVQFNYASIGDAFFSIGPHSAGQLRSGQFSRTLSPLKAQLSRARFTSMGPKFLTQARSTHGHLVGE
jgi:uncharacterized protein YjbI with pentapeptide repeats